jgi:PAS domain S-box-containing protein
VKSSILLTALVLLPLAGLALQALRLRRQLLRPLSLGVLVAGWLLSAWLLVLGHRARQEETEREFAALAAEAQDAVSRRMATYVDALRSGASFVMATPALSVTSWQTFAGSLDLANRYPGINGIGVIFPVARRETERHVAKIRSEGDTDFAVHDVPGSPPSERPDRAIISYIAPTEGNEAARGLDVYSEAERRRAAEESRDRGTAQLSGRIALVQDLRQQPGFLLFHPVYQHGASIANVDERRAAFLGWVYAPLVAARFLDGVLGRGDDRIQLHLFQGTAVDPGQLLYTTAATPDVRRGFARTTPLRMAGRDFVLGWNPTPDAPGAPLSPLTWIGFTCAIATLWLVGFSVAEQDLRKRVQQLVADRTTVLRQSELRYRELVESSPEPSYVVQQGVFVYLNPAALRLFGAESAAELVGTNTTSRVHPDYREIGLARQRMLAEGNRHVPLIELKLLRLDGEVLDVEIQATRIEYDGAPAIQVAARDMTERRQAQRQLQRTEARYQQLFDQMLSGVAVFEVLRDAQGVPVDHRLLYANRAFEEQTGLRIADEIGKTSETLGFQWPADVSRRIYAVAMTGEPIRYERFNERLRRHYEVRAFSPEHGQVALSFNDITEQHRLEQQLRQAQKMESIGRLAGGMAHDFNNNLGVIIGVADLMLGTIDPASPLRADVQDIHDAARRSAELTRHLLTFARRQSVAPVSLDLNSVVASSTRMLQRLIGAHIALVWHPGEELWPVFIDPSQVDQILANLSVNARDAIGDGGTITVSTANCTIDEDEAALYAGAVPGDYVRLSVRDTGHGMTPEVMAHLFEPFFTTKPVGEGTGLGLATVYGAVRQSGGFLAVDSAVDHGTTFRLYLPRHRGAASPEPTIVAAAAGRETILVVEDEPHLLRLIERALTGKGYRVLPANGPGEALAAAARYSEEIDLLLTDVVMPGMSGRDLAADFATRYPRIRQLFMSGYPGGSTSGAEEAEPLVNFLAKPFTISQLAVAVREVLDQSR